MVHFTPCYSRNQASSYGNVRPAATHPWDTSVSGTIGLEIDHLGLWIRESKGDLRAIHVARILLGLP